MFISFFFLKVYLAFKTETGQSFAIKAFKKEFLLSQNYGKESICNEILLMKKMNHVNILKLYEVYETKNSIYLIFETITGGDLLRRIKTNQSISLNIFKSNQNYNRFYSKSNKQIYEKSFNGIRAFALNGHYASRYQT